MIFIAVFFFTLATMIIFRISLEEATAKKITEKKIENVQSQCAILANQIMSNRFMIDNSNTESNAENTNSEAEGSNEESETVSEDTSSEENTDNSDNAE